MLNRKSHRPVGISRVLTRLGLTTAATVVALMGTHVALAQETDGEACPPGIHVKLPIQGLAFGPTTDRVDLDMSICNGTDETQKVEFALTESPADWTVFVRPKIGSYGVTSISLEPGASQELRLRVEPAVPKEPGTYDMTLRVSQGDTVLRDINLVAELPGVTEEEDEDEQDPLVLSSTFPFLRGPAASTFEFEVELRNRTGGDASVDLTSQAPPGWEVSFKPSFEEKLISSISVENNASERVKVEVETPRQADTGAFPVVVTATAEDAEQQLLLRVDITGRFDVLLSTPGSRLNLDAMAGDPAPGTLRIINTGNAPLENLRFEADPPADWNVVFGSSSVELVAPTAIDDVPFTITPSKDAVPGDYVVVFRTSNPQVLDTLEMRVTVTQSTVWGWVGIALVLVVIVVLIGLFARLGRR